MVILKLLRKSGEGHNREEGDLPSCTSPLKEGTITVNSCKRLKDPVKHVNSFYNHNRMRTNVHMKVMKLAIARKIHMFKRR